MIPAAYVGIWAATSPVASEYRWVPKSPFTQPAHYFLVVSKDSSGNVRAFVRNPEFNAGARIGMLDSLPDASSAQITIAKASDDGAPLTFHRASVSELRWFYPRSTASWSYREPSDLRDGWTVATPDAVHMQIEPLADLLRQIVANREPSLRSPYIQSISVARHGNLVLDEYFYGFDARRPHDVRSAGKSVTTLIVGRAMQDTHAFTPRSLVLSLLPQYSPNSADARKRAMTVENLMTMASGLACDDNDDSSPGNEDTMQSRPAGTDWYGYTLDLPMTSAPGTHAVYCTAGINLLGAITARSVREPLASYFIDRFAQPMAFQNYALWLMPPPVNEAYMGGGDYFRPRDFLKFGQLMLDGGTWHGKHIVDAAWVRASMQPRTEPAGEGDRYGYGWHIQQIDVDGRNYDVVNAGGNGGQLLMIVPALDLTIMVTAGNYNQFPVWRTFLPSIAGAAIRSCR